MVDSAVEFAFDLLGGALEGVFEWLASDPAGRSEAATDAERGRYVEPLYEERRPPPPGLPQDWNQ